MASLVLISIVGFQTWQELRAKPEVNVSIKDASEGTLEQVRANVKTDFEWYRDRVDNLQKLIAVLIGLSSLYTIVVAVTSYLDGQTYLDQVRNKAEEQPG